MRSQNGASSLVGVFSTEGQLNAGCEYREFLGPAADHQVLLRYLTANYRHSNAQAWAEHIDAGHVLIDGYVAHRDSVLRRGSELVWRRPPWVEPPAPIAFDVLYADDDVLAVAKPAGLPTLPGANFYQHTLLHQVQRRFPEATPVHRLGRWTSGIVLCACKVEARRDLTRQWSANQVEKHYRALASGVPSFDELTITMPIGPVNHRGLGTVYAANPKGKPALSHVRVRERRSDSFLCDVHITTGRPHQIRIHLASAGYPLVGDPLYESGGLPFENTRAVPGDPGYHLHAAELRFRHPLTGREQTLTCAPPRRLRTSATAD